MKLRLLSLVLLWIALIAGVQADTVEKREASEKDPCSVHCDENGCKKWCNGKWHDPGKREADEQNISIESSTCTCEDGECKRCDENGCNQVSNCNGKREIMLDEGRDLFNADKSTCKCLRRGYCEKMKRDGSGYVQVDGCGESSCYRHCDSAGCRDVCDGHCKCEHGRCEICFQDGCKQTDMCSGSEWLKVTPTNCQTCTDTGCEDYSKYDYESKIDVKKCHSQCDSDSHDILIPEKCTQRKDENGTMKYFMCGKYQCNPVIDCSRFAKCTCIKRAREDDYRRCYGYKHGEKHCRTLSSCTEHERIMYDELVEEHKQRVFSKWLKNRERVHEDWLKQKNSRPKRDTCDCPSDGGLCKQCDVLGRCSYVKECGLVTNRDTVAFERESDLL